MFAGGTCMEATTATEAPTNVTTQIGGGGKCSTSNLKLNNAVVRQNSAAINYQCILCCILIAKTLKCESIKTYNKNIS